MLFYLFSILIYKSKYRFSIQNLTKNPEMRSNFGTCAPAPFTIKRSIKGCMEAKVMLLTPAAGKNFTRLLSGELSREAPKYIFGSTYKTKEE